MKMLGKLGFWPNTNWQELYLEFMCEQFLACTAQTSTVSSFSPGLSSSIGYKYPLYRIINYNMVSFTRSILS